MLSPPPHARAVSAAPASHRVHTCSAHAHAHAYAAHSEYAGCTCSARSTQGAHAAHAECAHAAHARLQVAAGEPCGLLALEPHEVRAVDTRPRVVLLLLLPPLLLLRHRRRRVAAAARLVGGWGRLHLVAHATEGEVELIRCVARREGHGLALAVAPHIHHVELERAPDGHKLAALPTPRVRTRVTIECVVCAHRLGPGRGSGGFALGLGLAFGLGIGPGWQPTSIACTE